MSAGSAMQQAVAAEQAARDAIAAAEKDAAAALEAARVQSRAILNAVPARIARLRERGDRAVGRALAQIAADEREQLLKLHEAGAAPDEFDRAVAQVARRLAGGSP